LLHPTAWEHAAPGLLHRTGLRLERLEPVEPDSAIQARPDILHIAAKSNSLDKSAFTKLAQFADNGGLILIDAVDGTPEAIRAAREVFERLDVGEKSILKSDHPIVTGQFRQGRPLKGLRPTSAGTSLSHGDSPPPILLRSKDGRVVVMACPFDLTAALNGHFIWNRVGYVPEDTLRLVDNLLCFIAAQKNAPNTVDHGSP
jgi:hypothetical protein